MEEAGARGRAGAGDCSGARGSRGTGEGLRLGEGPNRDMVLWSWEAGAAAGAAIGAGVGTSGGVIADMVL